MKYSSITSRLANLGSDKWDIHILGRKMAADGKPIIELTIGEPDIPTDPALLDVCAASMREGRTRYSNGRGESAVLSAISAKYSRRTGRHVGEENVLYFPGTQTALFAVLMGLVEAGEKVLVPDPYYATYEAVVRAPGAEFVSVPLRAENGFRLQASDLEAAVSAGCRAVLLNNPHNPTGAVLSRTDLVEIGAVCERHGLWIISDEVYEDLTFGKPFFSPFDIAELAERTVVVSSISKSHAAPGFRSGWAVGPVELCDRLLPLSESMLFGCQPFIADMTAYALAHEIPTAETMRRQYKVRADLIRSQLDRAAGLQVLAPDAGMFVLIDVAATGLSGREFAERLLHRHLVSVMPGSSFGEVGKSFIRLSLTVPANTLVEACSRIAALSNSLLGEEEPVSA